MRSAFGGRDEIDVALAQERLRIGRPHQGVAHRIGLAVARAADRFLRHQLRLAELLDEIGAQVAGEEPLVLLPGRFVAEGDPQPRTQHGLRLQRVLQLRDGELIGVEELRVGPEAHGRAGVALPHGAHHLELRGHGAVLEADVVLLAAALDPALEPPGQRVDDGHAHAVQAAGEPVRLVGELAARVQPREDQLDTAHLLLRMDVDGHATAVVGDLQRAVLEEDDVDLLAVPREGLIDAVVDDLMGQVIGPRGVRVHAGPAPHGLQAA